MTSFNALVKNDLKLIFGNWKAIAALLTIPVVFICLFVYALSPYINKNQFIEPFGIALVDNEKTTESRVIGRQLEGKKIFSSIINTTEEKARELLSKNEIAAAIIIPADFSQSVYWGDNKKVTVIGNKTMPLQSFVVRLLAESAANLGSAAQSAAKTIYKYDQDAGLDWGDIEGDFYDSTREVFYRALARNDIFSSTEASTSSQVTPAEYYTAAIIVIFLMFAGMPAMKMLVTERCLGITGRLSTSPVKGGQVVLSKLLISILISVLQFSIIAVFTLLVFKNYWGVSVTNILLLFASIIFAVSAWSIFVSTVAKTHASADALGNLSILLMAVVGGSIYPLSSMPDFINALSKLTINRWAMDGFMAIFSGSRSIDMTCYLLPLVSIGAVFLMSSLTIQRLRSR